MSLGPLLVPFDWRRSLRLTERSGSNDGRSSKSMVKLPCSPQPVEGVEVAEDAGKESLILDLVVAVADAETAPLLRWEEDDEIRTEGAVDDVLAAKVVCEVVEGDFVTDWDVMLLDPLKLLDVAKEDSEMAELPDLAELVDAAEEDLAVEELSVRTDVDSDDNPRLLVEDRKVVASVGEDVTSPPAEDELIVVDGRPDTTLDIVDFPEPRSVVESAPLLFEEVGDIGVVRPGEEVMVKVIPEPDKKLVTVKTAGMTA